MLTRHTIEAVLAHYDLGAPQNFRIAPRGTINETAFVETEQGRFVVRRNQLRLGRTDMRRRHELLAWLAGHEIVAPFPVVARNGTTAVESGGRLYEVSYYLEGAEFNPAAPCQQVAVGEALARYHAAVSAFPAGPPPDQPRYSPAILLGLLERLLERDVMGDLESELHWYDHRAVDLRSALPPAAAQNLPHLLIHGDIHRDNLIFQGDEKAILLDYDQITCDARVTDLVDGFIAFATTESPPDWNIWGAFNGPLDLDGVARLLEGYTNINALSVSEYQALPILIEGAWLQGELRRVMVTPDGAVDYHQGVLAQGKWLAQWMDIQRVVLEELCGAAVA